MISRSFSGRRITLLLLGAVGMLLPECGWAQPAIAASGVVNSATYAVPEQPNGGIARGSIFTIFGTGLSQSTPASPSAFPLPTSLGGTSVTVDLPFFTKNAPLIYASPNQVSAIMPSSVPEGQVGITVSYGGQTSAPVTIQVVTSSFGIYSLDAQGNGPGVMTNSEYQIYSPTSAAIPGDVVTIWGTGLGPVMGNDGAGPLPGNLASIPVQVWVGLTAAQILYQGRSGCCAGLDQIAFVVPQVASACAVPVAVQIGDVVSNFLTLPVGGAGTRSCSDLNSTFSGVDTGGQFDWATLYVTRGTVAASASAAATTTDQVSGQFLPYNAALLPGYYPYFASPPPGTCIIYPSFAGVTAPVVNPHLDAGPALTLAGANGSIAVPAEGDGYNEIGSSTGSQPLFLTPGTYTISGPGGADVGAFSQSFTMPAPLSWAGGASALTMVRAQGQTFTWSGVGAGDLVEIDGYFQSGSAGSTLMCLADGAAGRFTVPPFVTLSLPAPLAGYSFGQMFLGTYAPRVFFKATGLNVGVISATNAVENNNVTLE